MEHLNEAYFLEQFRALLAIDSTTGQFREIQNYVIEQSEAMGFSTYATHKGGVLVDLGGEGNDIAVTAHLDDIGLMVRRINADGTLNVCPVGGLYPFYCVMENVRVHTRGGKVCTGTVCRTPNSVHVTEEELRSEAGDFRKNVCVVLDEDTKSAQQTRALGVEVGDYIGLEPRMTVSNGYVKSHFVDDKACAAVLLAVMRRVHENQLTPNRHTYFYFAAYEELGHGTTWLPAGVKDILAVDIAPTGPDQTSDERKVSLFAKDSRFPYQLELLRELQDAADRSAVDYVTDVFTPHYGSDGDGTVLAGYDVRHGAIGPGTANSHGYERTHMEGLDNTYRLLLGYLGL